MQTDANSISLYIIIVQKEVLRIETNKAKYCYQISKRTRIFVTPRVVEFSMKFNLPKSILVIHHNRAEDRDRHQ